MAAGKPDKRRERGVAMLIAVVSIAVLTVVAAEFAYNSRVDLQMAANQRDEVRAYYMAKSGVGMSRLLLRFQKQLDSMGSFNLGPLASMIPGLTGNPQSPNQPPTNQNPLGGAAGGLLGAMGIPTSINFQLWSLAKIDCHMLTGLVVDETTHKIPKLGSTPKPIAHSKSLDIDVANPELALKQSKMKFGGFEGCFEAKISAEETKLNLNKLDMTMLSSGPFVARLLDMFSEKRFEFLFTEEDANRVKVTPQELVIALHDWMDEDETQSTLNTTGMGEPFLKGFQDEAYFYEKYTPRYRPKNARYDTLDELYMVHGWNDKMMAAFRDRLTVYPDINSGININTEDPYLILQAVRMLVDPRHPDPRLGSFMVPGSGDLLFQNELVNRIRRAKMFSFFGMSVQDFINVVQSAGIIVNPSITANIAGSSNLIADKNSTYTITSVGEAGAVQKTITAVVRMDDMNLGRLVYWKEQ